MIQPRCANSLRQCVADHSGAQADTGEIVASEDGERLLAGHLLRQSADRITRLEDGTPTF